MSTLPVVLVAGFLGAGKTTLMRRLILDGHSRGLKVCVIVNEFGAADVDGNILREANAELMASITGGCACCAGQDDFHDTVVEIANRVTSEQPDVILIEASGLADPVILLEVLTSLELVEKVNVAAVLCVADAARHKEYSPAAPLAPLLFNQLRLADFILVNKADLADKSILAGLSESFQEVAPRAALLPTTECEMDFDQVWNRVLHSPPTRSLELETQNSSHAHSHTLFYPLPHPVEREKLEAALSTLPGEVWRAKGFVRVRGETGVQLLQYTGGNRSTPRWRLAPFWLPTGANEPPTGLVFIGAHLDEEKLREVLRSAGNLLAFF